MAITVDLTHCAVIQHAYRTANVHNYVKGATQNRDDESMKKLEQDLVEAADAPQDNHTVYEVIYVGRPTRYFMFTDSLVIEGREMSLERW